jgi:hypothetical protein
MFVALFSNTWTSDPSGSSRMSAAGFVDLTEKRVPATLGRFLVNCELHSHDRVSG